jgi:hypothetical protein
MPAGPCPAKVCDGRRDRSRGSCQRPGEAVKSGLLSRLARLEVRTSSAECRVTVRFGHSKRLPPEYTGERHVVVTRQLQKRGDQEWVDFEEVPGLDPEPLQIAGRRERPISRRLDVMFVSGNHKTESGTVL